MYPFEWQRKENPRVTPQAGNQASPRSPCLSNILLRLSAAGQLLLKRQLPDDR